MDYSAFKIYCPEEWKDIMIAELDIAGFDMMLETENGVEAYIEAEKRNSVLVDSIVKKYGSIKGFHYSWENIQEENWNAEWEKNYEPVVIEGKCIVRADFHQIDGDFEYELNITPRMSFGTGHHATTYLMLSEMMDIDFNGKRVIDAGCGTGVLSILAEKKGAGEILAYDIGEWCVENTLDNIAKNNCKNIQVELGTIDTVARSGTYDVLLANINKNVLLADIPQYAESLKKGGILLLSGFFVTDISDLENQANQNNLTVEHKDQKDGWAVLRLKLNP